MKKYRLKQWYPRIPVYLEDGYIISFDDDKGIAIYEFVNGTLDTFEMSGAELECTQYWEFIEEVKPLFITEDGVSIYINNIELFAVNDMFETASSTRFDFGVSRKEGWKLFYHESNADEYIWRNKRVFSYKDIQNYGVHPVNMIRVGELAKERIEK